MCSGVSVEHAVCGAPDGRQLATLKVEMTPRTSKQTAKVPIFVLCLVYGLCNATFESWRSRKPLGMRVVAQAVSMRAIR